MQSSCLLWVSCIFLVMEGISMSIIHYIATSDKKLTKTDYEYKFIIPNIDKNDFFYKGGISFAENMDDAELSTVEGVFQQFNVYAIRSTMPLDYETRYKEIFSSEVARYYFEQLLWFKDFIRKLLQKNDEVFVLRLDLGIPTRLGRIKSLQVGIDNWILDKEKDFMFEYGVVYQFVKDSVQGNFI